MQGVDGMLSVIERSRSSQVTLMLPRAENTG